MIQREVSSGFRFLTVSLPTVRDVPFRLLTGTRCTLGRADVKGTCGERGEGGAGEGEGREDTIEEGVVGIGN